MPERQIRQRGQPCRLLIQAGDRVKLLAAGLLKRAATRDADFFERLEAIGDKPGAQHVDAPKPFASQCSERVKGVGLEPFTASEPRLKAQDPLLRLESDLLREEPRGDMAEAMVRIAGGQRTPRHPVERQYKAIRPTLFLPIVVHAAGERSNVAGIVMKRVDEPQRRYASHRAEIRAPGIVRGRCA